VGDGSRGDSGATALVGLDGFVVRAQTVRGGEHWLLVETTSARGGVRVAAFERSGTAAAG
jgi:hypothetical protein